MKILILISFIYYSFQKRLNEIINFRGTKLEEKVYDVNFQKETFYLLQSSKIKVFNKDFSSSNIKYPNDVNINLLETSSFIHNETHFFISCTKDYILMIFRLESNELKLIKDFDYTDPKPENRKCIINLYGFNGNYSYVSVSYSFNNSNSIENKIYIYNLYYFNYSYINIPNKINFNISIQQTYDCAVINGLKYFCLYLDETGIRYFDRAISNLVNNVGQNSYLNISSNKSFTQIKIIKYSLNSIYLIGLIDNEGNQYHMLYNQSKNISEELDLNQIPYDGPSNLNLFSGYIQSTDEYYPVYYDSNSITITHLDIKNSIHTSLSFKPINSLDILFSRKINDNFIIITGYTHSYLYVLNYPSFDNSIQCSSLNLILGTKINYPVNITSDLKMSFDQSLNSIPFANKDSEVTIITESKDIIIIHIPETLIKENSFLIISFYDSNFYPSIISNTLPSLNSTIESLYLFNDVCKIILSTCYELCETCNSKGDQNKHLCLTCKDTFAKKNESEKEGNCYKNVCPENYAFYQEAFKCILCPEPHKGKWYYNDSINETACLYNSSDDCPENAKYYIPNIKQCFDKCPSDYPYFIPSKNECANSCPSTHNLIDNICIEKCPEYSLSENYECKCIGKVVNYSNGVITCEEIEGNYSITEQCREKSVKEKIEIGSNISEIKILYEIIERKDQITNQLEYKYYRYDEKEKVYYEMGVTSCKDTEVNKTTPVKNNITSRANETFDEGYDIFNPNDSFYDECTSYHDGKSDVPMSVRKSNYYQEIAFCESDCKYISFNPKNMTITCSCPFHSYTTNVKSTFSPIPVNEDFLKNTGNSALKCFSIADAIGNVAFAAGSAVSIGQVAMLIYYLFNNSTMYQNLLSAFMIIASPPRNNQPNGSIDNENHNYFNGGNINKKKNNNIEKINVMNSNNSKNDFRQNKPIFNIKDSNIFFDGNENGKNKNLKMNDGDINSEIISERKEEFDDMGPDFSVDAGEVVKDIIEKPHLDEEYIKNKKKKCIRPKLDDTYFDLNFNQAIKKKLPFFHYYINLLYYNQMILFMITKDKWNYTLTKISLFLNVILFSMLFNTVFINDSLLIYINENEGDLCLNKAFGRIILAVILTIIVNCVLKLLGLTKMEFEGCLNNEAKILKQTEKPAGIEGFVETELGHQNEGNNDDIDNNIDNQLGTNSEESEILYYKKKTNI